MWINGGRVGGWGDLVSVFRTKINYYLRLRVTPNHENPNELCVAVALADPGGMPDTGLPCGTQFFHFCIHFHLEAPTSEVDAPNGFMPCNGKSWIRHCCCEFYKQGNTNTHAPNVFWLWRLRLGVSQNEIYTFIIHSCFQFIIINVLYTMKYLDRRQRKFICTIID